MKIQELIKKYDPENQFNVLVNSYQQIEYAWNNKYNISALKDRSYNNIVIAGLGGSAISADLIGNFLHKELKLPLTVVRSYNLPPFADKNTLLICSSYSGGTEETLSVLEQGYNRGCGIAVVTTGGKAGSFAAERNIPLIKLKEGYQPRYALGVSFFTLLRLFQEMEFVSDQSVFVSEITKLWKERGEEFSLPDNSAVKYAEQLLGYTPVIYSAAELTGAAGYRFKCQLNENSKVHAFAGIIPELNHNEIIGWETYNSSLLNAKVVNIIDPDYHPQITKRFELTSGLVKKMGAEVIDLESKHPEFKVRLMDIIYLTDWISYFLALLKEKDPSEIDFIHYLKNNL